MVSGNTRWLHDPSARLTRQRAPAHSRIGCSTHKPMRLRRKVVRASPVKVKRNDPSGVPTIPPCQTNSMPSARWCKVNLISKPASSRRRVRSLSVPGTVPQWRSRTAPQRRRITSIRPQRTVRRSPSSKNKVNGPARSGIRSGRGRGEPWRRKLVRTSGDIGMHNGNSEPRKDGTEQIAWRERCGVANSLGWSGTDLYGGATGGSSVRTHY